MRRISISIYCLIALFVFSVCSFAQDSSNQPGAGVNTAEHPAKVVKKKHKRKHSKENKKTKAVNK